MADSIFLIQGEDQLIEMGEKPYDSEALLQKLLAKFPDLLAGGQIDTDSPRHWLLIKREMGIPAEEAGGDRWSVDHLFLDQDGIPTLVEVKQSSDTRIRRAVVGQMLDYAANAVVYWPVETIRAEYEKTCDADGVDSMDRLAKFLEDADPEDFWQQVKTNLQAGNIRMLFVADVIPPELRQVVEFLNKQMDPAEVLAVEIKQYVKDGMKTLVPRVIGQTAEAETRKGGKSKTASTQLAQASQDVKELYEQLKITLCGFGNDVQVMPLKYYIAFKRNGNFASVQVQADGLIVFTKVDPDSIILEEDFTKDMRNIGHQGTGDLKITIHNKDDLTKAIPLLKKSYDDS
jgi:predicted transport protein